MTMVHILAKFLLIAGLSEFEDHLPADATKPEQVQHSIRELDHPNFEQRENAVQDLFSLGHCAIPALKDAAETGPPEVAVRAFDVLHRLYFREDEQTYEAVDQAFQKLMHVENLNATSRAERLFESVSDLRQVRAAAKLERLGAIVHYADPNFDRYPVGRPRIDHVMFGRDWVGTEDDFRLIVSIDDLRLVDNSSIYVVRGVTLSDAMRLELLARMPSLNIQMRGPARLGVTNSSLRGEGCVIGKVEPGSAADGAGLKQDDQIIEIGGQKVQSFERLIEVIGQKEPGDLVPIVFRRGTEEHQGIAKLSAWSKKVTSKLAFPKP